MPSALNNCTNTEKRAAANQGAIAAIKAKAARSLMQPGLRAVTPVRLAGLYGHNPRQNHLLAGLPTADYERILPHLEFVSMPFGMTVCESDTAMQHAYFLTSSIVSLMYETRDGASSETAVVGNEGVVGVALFMGGGNSLNRAIVKSAGYGFRLKASVLKEEVIAAGAAFHYTPGTVHRVTAIEDTMILEVSTPQLDDVVRLEDAYGREGTSAA